MKEKRFMYTLCCAFMFLALPKAVSLEVDEGYDYSIERYRQVLISKTINKDQQTPIPVLIPFKRTAYFRVRGPVPFFLNELIAPETTVNTVSEYSSAIRLSFDDPNIITARVTAGVRVVQLVVTHVQWKRYPNGSVRHTVISQSDIEATESVFIETE